MIELNTNCELVWLTGNWIYESRGERTMNKVECRELGNEEYSWLEERSSILLIGGKCSGMNQR